MNDNVTAALIALAIFTTGLMAGTVLISTVGPEPTTLTVTAPPVTSTVTSTVRVTERATRSRSRGTVSPPSRSMSEGAPRVLPRDQSRVRDYQTYARARVSASQWPCLRDLWTRESHWNPRSVGALVDGQHVVGIPQLRGLKVTDGWRHQVDRGLAYIAHRHGTPCAAWAHFGRRGWY
jgi:hypothetical protein